MYLGIKMNRIFCILVIGLFVALMWFLPTSMSAQSTLVQSEKLSSQIYIPIFDMVTRPRLLLTNLASKAAIYQIAFLDHQGITVATHQGSIAANASATIELSAITALPETYAGLTVVSSTQPLTSPAAIYLGETAWEFAVTQAAFTTRFLVGSVDFNTGTNPIAVSFSTVNGELVYEFTVELTSFESYIFAPVDLPQVPADFQGTVSFRSQRLIVVAVAPLSPVLFIPGVAGSQLIRNINNAPDSYVWPIYRDPPKTRMRLKPGLRDDSIYTDDVIRTYDAFNIPFNIPGLPKGHNPIYGPFLAYLVANGYVEYEMDGQPAKRTESGCDTSQTSATLFVFPWDWRFGAVDAVTPSGEHDPALSLAPNNIALLRDYVRCIRKIHPDAEITLVTHSMGWFLGRSYVLQNNPSDHHIEKHIAIAPPRLGAPQAIAMMLTGNWIPDLIGKDLTRTLLEHFPGAHQLLPSQIYWELTNSSPLSVLTLSDGDEMRIVNKDVQFGEFQSALQTYYRSPAEGTDYHSTVPFVQNMQAAYTDPAFADLRDDNSGVTYHIIYGVQTIEATTEKVVEKWMIDYIDEEVLSEGRAYDLVLTRGDGTVPEMSASTIGPHLNLNGNATLHPLIGDAMTHQPVMSEQRLQDCVLVLLNGGSICDDAATATSKESSPARYVKLWGIDSLQVANGISTTGNLMTTTLSLEIFPEITSQYLGDHSMLLIIADDQTYTITFSAQGEYFETENRYGTGETSLHTIRFTPQPVAGQTIALMTTPDSLLAEMRTDTDANGSLETVVAPSADLQEEQANDQNPPTVMATYDAINGLVIKAVDDRSGVASILYTVDGKHYSHYTEGVTFTDPQITKIVVIAQDHAGNRSDAIVLFVTDQVSNILYLPSVMR